MAAFIQFFITYSLAMMAFWILEITTIVFIVYSFEYFLGGQMFPDRHHAGGRAGGVEMDAVLYELFCPSRFFSSA
jgi:ABC-2 type transport system permease protein